MQWWQIVLILLVSIAGGVAVGAFVGYLILRFTRRREATSTGEGLLGRVKKRFAKEREAPRVAKGQPKLAMPELLTEVKYNRKIAVEPLGDKLTPFQTEAWDARQYEIDKLPANLRDDLDQVYTDIRLANSLVWLSAEFNRRSPNLDDNYMKLRASIAERLDRIKPLIDQLGK